MLKDWSLVRIPPSRNKLPLSKRDGRRQAHPGDLIDESRKPISAFHPIKKVCIPKIVWTEAPLQPSINLAYAVATPAVFEAWAIELHEWISLLVLGSPRISKNDTIDPFLCRYAVSDSIQPHNSGIVSIQWSGFIPAHWVRSLFADLRYVKS